MAGFIGETKGIHVDVIDLDAPERLDNRMEIQIFRIMQELFTNIVKHSNATKVLIQLTRIGDQLSITIEDNGQGFSNYSPGVGLENIAKRIHELKGHHEIVSVNGNGTSVDISIPL